MYPTQELVGCRRIYTCPILCGTWASRPFTSDILLDSCQATCGWPKPIQDGFSLQLWWPGVRQLSVHLPSQSTQTPLESYSTTLLVLTKSPAVLASLLCDSSPAWLKRHSFPVSPSVSTDSSPFLEITIHSIGLMGASYFFLVYQGGKSDQNGHMACREYNI